MFLWNVGIDLQHTVAKTQNVTVWVVCDLKCLFQKLKQVKISHSYGIFYHIYFMFIVSEYVINYVTQNHGHVRA
jgi:hypothetical protein